MCVRPLFVRFICGFVSASNFEARSLDSVFISSQLSVFFIFLTYILFFFLSSLVFFLLLLPACLSGFGQGLAVRGVGEVFVYVTQAL